MITSEKIFKVAERLYSILPYAQHEGALDMYEPDVSVKPDIGLCRVHPCGTIHCHGGWYYLAKNWDRKSTFIPFYDSVGYGSGVDEISTDLGFKGADYDVQRWARDNPEIWGNPNGGCMFNSAGAFNYEGKLTLEKIAEHWVEVGMRQLIQELYEKED